MKVMIMLSQKIGPIFAYTFVQPEDRTDIRVHFVQPADWRQFEDEWCLYLQ